MRYASETLSTIKFGIVAGLATWVLYPLLLFAPLPDLATVVFAALLGPVLGFASWGLWAFLRLDRRTTMGNLGVICNLLGGALLTAMLLVQLAVTMDTSAPMDQSLVSVWLGLDVAWDTYVGLGTLFLSLAMIRHPRLGRVMGITGAVLAILVLAFNYYTFPTPPAGTLIDLGPVVGLWYLVVTVMIWRSLGWAKTRVVEG